jgi:Uncharacterized low-complexity proteins
MKATPTPIVIDKQSKNLHDPKGIFKKLTETFFNGGVAKWNKIKRSLLKETLVEDFGIGFADADFSGLDLTGINFSGLFLGGCIFTGADLTNADFRNSRMWQANFDNATLTNAKFSKAELRYSTFIGASLQKAWFDFADLTLANFEKATITDADFSFADLSGADFSGADISGSNVTGVTTWSLKVDPHTIQKDLIVEPWYDPLEKESDDTHSAIVEDTFKTNNIETSQLLYLLTSKNDQGQSEKMKPVIDSLTDKIVLILGRFGENRIKVLRKIRSKLIELGYVPVIFDFPKPENRDLIESVVIFAGLSNFVVADLTFPSSIPLEAMLITSAYCVPFAPIIQGGNQTFAMFDALKTKYDWVLEPLHYKNPKHLIMDFKKEVVDRCEEMRLKIKGRRDAPKQDAKR